MQNLGGVVGGIDFRIDAQDGAGFVRRAADTRIAGGDKVGDARRAAFEHAALANRAIRADGRFRGVGEKGKRQIVFGGKFFMTRRRVRRNAKNFNTVRGKLAVRIANSAGLGRAPWRVILRVEVDEDEARRWFGGSGVFNMIGECVLATILVGEVKLGGEGVGGKGRHRMIVLQLKIKKK